jgi:hypothetical protein
MAPITSRVVEAIQPRADHEASFIAQASSMTSPHLDRRTLIAGVAGALALPPFASARAGTSETPLTTKETRMTTTAFTKMPAPAWLLAFWKEIDDKTWGAGFDCFADDAVCHLGVADWHGKETIRANLRQFVDKQMTTHHDVVEYLDSPHLKVFRGFVTMVFDDKRIATVKPTMQHFFYMDEKDPTRVKAWYGSVGPTGF